MKNLLVWRIVVLAKRIKDGEEPTIDVHKAVTELEEIMDKKQRASIEALEELWNA